MTTLILGAGKTGRAAYAFLKNKGEEVRVFDDNKAVLDSFGGDAFSSFEGITRVILSPGLPILWPRVHTIYRKAKLLQIPVISDIDLLQLENPNSWYLGITGTNGKSTTTALLGFALGKLRSHVYVGGNLGTPALSLPLREGGAYVLEMSSYQLEASQISEFNVGILLNITPDHLDRHGGMAGYVYAKQLIFKGMTAKGFGIIGVDEPQTREIYDYLFPLMGHHLIPISTQRILDSGYSLQGTKIYKNGEFLWNMDAHPKLKGPHNGQNIMAVWAALTILGFEDGDIRNAILEFQGLEHRQEHVLETKEGLVFINDSKATNADATIQALKAYEDVYLILGGRPKTGGITELIPYFGKIRHALLIGEAADEFAHVLKAHGVDFTITHTLEAALNFDFKTPGTVLFSPACASFDQFNNFEERGRAFKDRVDARHHKES